MSGASDRRIKERSIANEERYKLLAAKRTDELSLRGKKQRSAISYDIAVPDGCSKYRHTAIFYTLEQYKRIKKFYGHSFYAKHYFNFAILKYASITRQ